MILQSIRMKTRTSGRQQSGRFKEHLYWYALDSGFIGVGLRHISLNGRQYSGKEMVVKLLLEKGATTEAEDGDRQPSLQLGAGNREEVVAKLL